MIEMDFSNSQIARALKIDDQTVKNYRNGDQNVKENIKSKKTNRKKRRIRDTSEDQDQIRRSNSEYSDTDPLDRGGKIEFIGGNPSEEKKGDKSMSEEKDYECPGCGTEFNGQPKFCPGCGKELDWS